MDCNCLNTNILHVNGTYSNTAPTASYNSAFQPLTESISGLYSKAITRSYDSLGRSTGMNIGTEYNVAYGYDAYGRLGSVVATPVPGVNDTFSYSYLANSNLISSISYPHGISVGNTYESNRDLVTSIDNKVGATSLSRYDYANDSLGDANKNITDYIDSTGVIQGHYEYSPFGKITVASGTNPDAFDFRFSSESFDSETGLVYYNHRYYSPELGRWLSRDPIAERGGYNLYAMAANNPISKWDRLGLLMGGSDQRGCCPSGADGAPYDKTTHCCCPGEQIVSKAEMR